MKRTCTFCGPQLPGPALACPACGLWLPTAAPSALCSIADEPDAASGGGGGGGALVAEPASTEEDAPVPIPVHSAPGPDGAHPRPLAAFGLSPLAPAAAPAGDAPGVGVALAPYPARRPDRAAGDRGEPFHAGGPLHPARVRTMEAVSPPNPVQRLQGRLLHGTAGAILLGLFFASWSGARSWELLPLLQGAAFVRQLLLLVGGVTFLSTAVLPVPPLFRGVIGLLLGVFGLSLGGVMLSPWQNLMAALVVLLLPAALILVSWHSRGAPGLPSLRMQRALGLLGGIALLSLYLVPRDGVTPLRVAVELLRYNQDDAARFLGTYLLLPLPLLGFSLVALLSEDVAILGELLAWLLCAYGPGALLILLIDNTQAYVAAVVLGYSLCGAYGLVSVLQRLSATAERDSLR